MNHLTIPFTVALLISAGVPASVFWPPIIGLWLIMLPFILIVGCIRLLDAWHDRPAAQAARRAEAERLDLLKAKPVSLAKLVSGGAASDIGEAVRWMRKQHLS